MFPYLGEYDEADLGETDMLMSDGTKAKLYSAARPGIVKKHFEWMQEYGISGVFHHRFMQDLNLQKNRKMICVSCISYYLQKMATLIFVFSYLSHLR